MKTPAIFRVAPILLLALFGIVVSGLVACGALGDERPPVSGSEESFGTYGGGSVGGGAGGYGGGYGGGYDEGSGYGYGP